MARKLPLEYPGAIYHVMNRGDRRELIFKDDADRQRFVETLGEACAKTGWLHASLDFKWKIADCRLTRRAPTPAASTRIPKSKPLIFANRRSFKKQRTRPSGQFGEEPLHCCPFFISVYQRR